jgi:rod shape-determining protein MreB
MLNRLFKLLGADLALDLGAANTRIGVVGLGVVLCEPSVVAVEEGARRVLAGGAAVGHLARQMLGRTPQSIAVVRPLNAGAIADFELCEAMLRAFLAKAQSPGWRAKPRVLATVPGAATAVEKRAVYNSLFRAGARQVFVMPKAKAAALGVGLPVIEPVASMICDIGAGGAEVAVLSLGEIVASRSAPVGGDAFDLALVHYLKRRFSLRVGPAAAEALRVAIGSACPLADELVEEVRGVDAISQLPRKAVISSEEAREALGPPLEQLLAAIRETLDDCPNELAADLIDHGIVLAGGGALLRGLDRYITEHTGLPARVHPDAAEAVVRGALVCLERFDLWRGSMEASDAA